MKIPVESWLGFGGLIVLVVLAMPTLRDVWRGRRNADVPAWVVRGWPAATAVVIGMLVALPLMATGMASDGTVADILAVLSMMVIILIVAAACIWLTASIACWPKFAVPPPLRNDSRGRQTCSRQSRPRRSRGKHTRGSGGQSSGDPPTGHG